VLWSHRAVIPLSRRLLTACATLALLLGLAGALPAEATAPAATARADCSAQLAAAQQAEAVLAKKFAKFTKAKHNLEVAEHQLTAAHSPHQQAQAEQAVKAAKKKFKRTLKKFQAAQAAHFAAQDAYEACAAQP
jgi:hypothetical protein